MPQFIEVDGVVVNLGQVSFVDFRDASQAVIHLGSNSVTCKGDSAEGLRRFFRPAPEAIQPDEPVTEGLHIVL